MNKKIFLLPMLLMLLLPFALAAPFEVIVSSSNITAYAGETVTIPITIINNLNKSINNISITGDMFSMSVISEIPNNVSRQHTITFVSPSPITGTANATFKFYFYANSTIQANQSEVSISRSSYSPNALQIFKGDTVKFTNLDSLIHSVTNTSLGIDEAINPNQSYSKLFDTINAYTFFDRYFFFTIYINVLDNIASNLAHEPSEDLVKFFNLLITYKPSNYSASVMPENFTAAYNSTTEGVLSIYNFGSETIHNINLNAEWITFSKNNFDLAADQTTYITFSIRPAVTSTSETNKNYTKQILISTTNAGSISKNVNIYVPYANLGTAGNLSSDLALIEYFKNVYCPAYPSSIFCNRTAEKETIYVTNYTSPTVPYNYTPEHIDQWDTSLAQIITAMQNFLLDSEKSKKILADVKNSSDSSYLLGIENKKQGENTRLWFLAFVIFVFSLASIASTAYFIIKLKKKSRKHED